MILWSQQASLAFFIFLLINTCFSSSEILTEPISQVKIVNTQLIKSPKAFLLFFPGGTGRLKKKSVSKRLSNNLLMRVYNKFASLGYHVVVFGTKTNLNSYNDAYRISDSHKKDFEIINNLFNKNKLPIFLVGVSRGVISAAHIWSKSRKEKISGLILISSVISNPVFKNVNFQNYNSPILFIHHKKDRCHSSLYKDAWLFFKGLKNHQEIEFKSFEGGKKSKSKPCKALSAHGFYGVEDEAVSTINKWMNLILHRDKSVNP